MNAKEVHAAASAAIVIGAGPAGLAVGACLKKRGMSCIILEQANSVASSWRNHYERLHLHTVKAFSALPLLPFPPSVPRYPSRDDVIAYLDSYAAHFGLDIRCGEKVMDARRENGLWQVTSSVSRYQSPNLVIASGYNRMPNLPSWKGQEHYRGTLIHSSAYRNGAAFEGKRVLVVGFGNSGGEIAIDLHEHGARPELSVRGPVNVVPREILGIPSQLISIAQQHLPLSVRSLLNGPVLRTLKGDLSRFGLRQSEIDPASQIESMKRIPLIDIGTLDLIAGGQIRVRPAIESFTPDGVIFTDKSAQDYDAVILATGYRTALEDYLHADGAFDDHGRPRESGKETLPGLFFCGFRVTATGSLREIGKEARRIGLAIAKKQVSKAD